MKYPYKRPVLTVVQLQGQNILDISIPYAGGNSNVGPTTGSAKAFGFEEESYDIIDVND